MTAPDRLFDLLPSLYRERDQHLDWPLRALLRVVAEQVDVVEDDIAQLYENWFVETCDEWVVPYIGDLVGYRPAHEAGTPGHPADPDARRRNRVLVPRRAVANTVRHRRRRGTLTLLELLARDVAGWPARAVEGFRLLAYAQPVNHLRLARGRTLDLRDGDALDRLEGPFDTTAHTVDVRRVASMRTRGRHNIPSVPVFAWRLESIPVTQSPAYCVEEAGPHCFTFSVLGNDAPLFRKPEPLAHEDDPIAEANVPERIRRRPLDRDPEAFYGAGRSFEIRLGRERVPVPLDEIVPADLTDWAYRPRRGTVAVDPVLGRVAFAPGPASRRGVWVSYHYGTPAAFGGGEYARPITQAPDAVVYRVGEGRPFTSINDALATWRDEAPEHAVVELTDSNVYVEQLGVELREGQSLQLRAAERARPTLRLLDWQTDRPDALTVTGAGSCFVLDGLLVTGRGLELDGRLDVVVRHSTLVPGWSLHNDCRPRRPTEPSIVLSLAEGSLSMEHSIVGSIRVVADAVATEPVPVRLADSVLDATDTAREALGDGREGIAHAVLTVVRSTVFGTVHAHAVDLAENSIFTGQVRVARRQRGCMRFCWVPAGSRTPRRHHCQPDLAEALVAPERREQERVRVEPEFASERYGMPDYARLAPTCEREITQGADDGSELGVFHDLFEPQRLANLLAALADAVPAGTDVGVHFVT